MKKIMLFVMSVFSCLLIGGGLYLNYLSYPKRVIGTFLKNVNSKAEKVFNYEYIDYFSDDFTFNSSIKFNVESDYLEELKDSPDYADVSNMIKNINNSVNTLEVSQKRDDKKLLVKFDSKINNNELINLKYFINNNKQYYFLNGFLDHYIDGGNNMYFESLSESISGEEFKYLYDLINKSVGEAFKEEDFHKEFKDGLCKIEVSLDGKRIVEIAKEVVSKLEEDKRANDIITKKIYKNFFKNFKKNVDESSSYSSNNKIVILVDADQVSYEVVKFEIKEVANKEEMQVLGYSKDKDNGLIYYREYNKDVFKIKIKTIGEDKYKLVFVDSKDKNVGEGEVALGDDEVGFKINFDNDDTNVKIDFKSKINSKTSESLNGDISLSVNALQDNKSIFNGKMEMSNKIKKGASNINEDVSGASSLSEEDSNKLSLKMESILEQLRK